MITEAQKQLSTLLEYSADALDIPEGLDRELTEKYTHLAEWIRADNEERYSTDSEIYPQGSRRLGTLIPPVKATDDYDIDLVYRRDLVRSSITQKELKDQTGEQLCRYIADLRRSDLEVPELEEGRRCWTLRYGDRYHLDVLPSLPDDQAHLNNIRDHEHGIIITDKDLRFWQASNPKGYANWFRSQMATALLEGRRAMAKAASVEIEDIPEETVKAPLQRVVQLLKRHRDECYAGNPDDKPISIIITTLTARAYEDQSDLYDAITSITRAMPGLIEKHDGIYWIPNPVNPSENFADKWQDHPERATRFFEWLVQVESDLSTALMQRGIDNVTSILGESFGQSIVERAAKRYGNSMMEARTSGKLKATTRAVTLGVMGAISVIDHTFFGDVHET